AAARLLAAPEAQEPADAQGARHLCERTGVDDRRAKLRQLTLGQVRVATEQLLGDHEAEHGVAEELQPLVGRQAAVLVGVGTVRHGPLDEVGVDVAAQRLDERAELLTVAVGGGHHNRARARTTASPTVRSRSSSSSGSRKPAGASGASRSSTISAISTKARESA